jgi:predicted XRE-type DNA-binding protein
LTNFTFSNAYLEGITSTDLDGSGSLGSGTIPSGLNAYSSGDNFVAAGKLSSVANLNTVKAYLDSIRDAQLGMATFNGSYLYEELEDTAANLSAVSSTDIGNISDTLTIADSYTSPAAISVLQSIKANFAGTTFNYDGIKGTAKELADSRSGGYDWITNITANGGLKHAHLTDLSASPTHLSTLVNGLNTDDYQFTIAGLTYGAGNDAFIGGVEGPSLAYRSDSTPDATTSFAEGAQSFVSGDYTVTAMGFLNKIPEEDLAFADFNLAGDDASNNVGLKIHFYEGEQLSHVNISGATVSTTAGYKYTQTAGTGTSSVTDDIWTLELKLDAGQPARSTSVSDNTGAEVLGVMINSVSAAKVGGNSDYGGSVFRTNAFWEDINLMSSSYKFSDLSPGFLVDGTNGEEVDFDFYFTKNYLERTFSTDFDNIDGGFAGTALNAVDASNDHTGSYIDVSKASSLSALRLPVTITDVSATTAGGLTDFYEVAFRNDSWSQANLSMVYGPSINAAPSPSPSSSPTPTPTPEPTPEPTTEPTTEPTPEPTTSTPLSPDVLPADVSNLEASDFLILTPDALSELTNAQVMDISPSAMRGFTSDHVSELSDEAVSAFSMKQVKQLSAEAVAGLSKSHMSELSPKAFKGFTSDHVSRMSDQAVSAFSMKQVKQLSAEAVAGLSKSHMSELSPKAVKGFTSDHVSRMSDQAVSAFSMKQVKQLSAEAVAGLSKSHMSELSPKAIKGFTSDHLEEMPKKAFQSLDTDQLSKLGKDAVTGLTSTHLKTLTASEMTSFKPGMIKLIDPDSMSGLKPKTLDGFTKRHVRALSNDQLEGLSRQQVKKSDDFIDALSNKQATFLSSLNGSSNSSLESAEFKFIPVVDPLA